MQVHSPKQLTRAIHLLASAALLMAGCSRPQTPPVEVEAGLTLEEVRDALGEPDEIQEFVMPDGPFFGPQEALSGLVPAGSLIEEWRYELDDEVRFVWFYEDPASGQEGRRLVATIIVPKDAIY